MKRTILVTGGNRGIGKAVVEELSQSTSDTVLLGCRNLSEGEKIAKAFSNNVKAVKLDIGTRESLKEDMMNILNDYQSIDVLVNNAGVLNEEDVHNIPLEKLDQSLRVNSVAPIELIQIVLPKMIEKSYGRIVNVSSGWGSFNEGLTGPFSYSVSKATINAVTYSLSQRLSKNILINSACPGWVKTRMGGDQAPRTPAEGADTIAWLANLAENGPTGGFFRDRKPIEW